ncbi:MAG: hypothetical protein JSV88_10665 [Candidatus Aminicenantes bacterium]|nr:MAG: hypothetical protein JSV88_10665 [Candidatus Aminicenantes bacterium]
MEIEKKYDQKTMEAIWEAKKKVNEKISQMTSEEMIEHFKKVREEYFQRKKKQKRVITGTRAEVH